MTNALLIGEAVNPHNVCRTLEHLGQNFSEISRTKSQEGCNHLVVYQLPDDLIAQCYQDQLATKKKKMQKKKKEAKGKIKQKSRIENFVCLYCGFESFSNMDYF